MKMINDHRSLRHQQLSGSIAALALFLAIAPGCTMASREPPVGRVSSAIADDCTDAIGPGDTAWQTDGFTLSRSASLYHLISEFFP
jgi:hypothetical protein